MRGRRRHIDPPVKKHVNFPKSVVAQVDAALADPLRGGPAYGGWSGLLTLLVNGWLAGDIKLPVEPFRADLSALLTKEPER
jgi:hypothetical protein